MNFKPGIPNDTLEKEILVGAKVLEQVFLEKLEMTITSTTDGEHMKGSLHYSGKAVDIRTRDLDPAMRYDIFIEAKKRLSPDFDLVMEGDHYHLEYDVKEETK